MANKDYLKDNYHEAWKAMHEGSNNRNDEAYFSFRMLQALRDMAEADVYPDATFSDDECNVWSMFHANWVLLS